MKNYNSIYMLALAISIGACNGQKIEKEALGSETIAVKTYLLQQSEKVILVSTSGLITTENEARYAFKIGGVIDQIVVQEGQSFTRGSLLASLRIDEIESGFMQAKLGMEKAARDLGRITNLYKDSVATLEQLQNTQTAYDIAKMQLDAVAFNKEFASIYAVSDGFVTKKLANVGEIILEGTPVLAINDTDADAWVLKAGLSDRDWTLVALGDSVTVNFDAFPFLEVNGIVIRKSQAADQSSGSFQVEIKLDMGTLQPAIGMFGKAVIFTRAVQKYHTIPYDALVEADGKKAFVFVPVGGNTVRRKAIEIASFDDEMVQVKAGLEDIREIVQTNSAFLNERSTISIIQ